MKNKLRKFLGIFVVALALVMAAPHMAAAQDQQDDGNDGDDPPSRVARLALTNGEVSFEPAGTDDWVAATLNRPITTGDKLWSDNNSRAELNTGSASIRLSSMTGFSFLNLTDDITQIRLTEGTIRVRVKELDENETFEIDTPNLAFSVLRAGTYRVTVNEGGDTTVVKVLSGQGEVTGGGQAYTVHSNETGTFNGTDDINGDVQAYGNDNDDFDNWCADRDRREDRSVSAKYVSTDVIGYQDLDDNGGWRDTPEYGTIWFPHTTVVGWAPYHYGHWAYIVPWGYTWVDDAPWGFAPFHYGRWVTVRGVWGWVPVAPRPRVVTVAYVRPVYAPALVAWVGGPHFSVGVAVGGGGNVGWFPLGPREVYVPSYRVSRRYVNRVNVSNTTVNTTIVNNYYNTTVINKNVTNVTYINQRVPGAVVATNRQTFVNAQSVSRNVVKVDAREAASAPVAYNAPTGAPSKQAVLGGSAASRFQPPARLQQRTVVAKTAPPPAPVSFVKQQQAIEANGGRPLGISQTKQIAQQQNGPAPRSNIRIAPPAKQVTPQNVQANRPGQPGQVNRPGQPGQPNVAQPNTPNNSVPQNRPGPPVNGAQQNNPPVQNNSGQNNVGQNNNTPSRPGSPQANAPVNAPVNTPANTPASPQQNTQDRRGNRRTLNDRPNTGRPTAPTVNPQLEQKQQQQQEQLRQKQDQERQKVEQQQVQQQQKLQQQSDQRKQEQAQQKQQQQLEQLERKHDQEQQKLQNKQQQQQQKQERRPPPQKEQKPPKDKDRPHGN